MLLELHVRNFALIEKADLEFKEGLTVLSGETGAGKSILIDSIAACLGGKAGKDVIRTGTECAYIELIFSAGLVRDNGEISERLRESGIEPDENGTLIISRKILPNRSIFRVNDEAVTAAALKELTGHLIDIHGQHEHQTLLYASTHLKFIDLLSPAELKELKRENAGLYEKYASVKELLNSHADRSIREREAEILRYEVKEIEEAGLREGEEEELHSEYVKIRNAARITELLSKASEELDTDGISKACRAVSDAAEFDPALKELEQEVSELDGLLSDAVRNLSDYTENLKYDEERFTELNNRLDLIHRLQDKYGNDIEGINRAGREKKERLEFLENFEEERNGLQKKKAEYEKKLEALSLKISGIRKKTAEELKTKIRNQLSALNFENADFDIVFTELKDFTADGKDGAEFIISTNPGEPMKPLKDVASGGELSRIMLALKTVLADTDETETLIFDEIDAGISGRTAQKVAERLSLIGGKRQVFCITHLPQIAAMADHHYLIRKESHDSRTKTVITEITGASITEELSRLIGGTEITPSVKKAAGEMKKLADEKKRGNQE
jgi:DNA repair protein RecN (Recombination protein N)